MTIENSTELDPLLDEYATQLATEIPIIRQSVERGDPAMGFAQLLDALQAHHIVPTDAQLSLLHHFARRYDMHKTLMEVTWDAGGHSKCRLC